MDRNFSSLSPSFSKLSLLSHRWCVADGQPSSAYQMQMQMAQPRNSTQQWSLMAVVPPLRTVVSNTIVATGA